MSGCNWNDPASRLALLESVGIDEYNRRMQQHIDDSTVAVIAGHCIRTQQTQWALVYTVGDSGFATLDEAMRFAKAHPKELDATERLRQHALCCAKRDAAIARASELLVNHDFTRGLDVADEAELWELRAAALDPSSGVTEMVRS
jgi:hypothetical protein